MKFAEELKQTSRKIIEEMAITFSIKVQPKLLEYAVKGFREAYMDLGNGEQAQIMESEEFINLVKELLDELEIEVVEKPISELFPSLKKKYIHFSW